MFLRRAAALRLLLLIGVPVVATCVGVAIWQQGGRYVSTEDAYVKTDIAQISPEVAGRVIEVAVRDHTAVRAGDLLLRLDPASYQLALEEADAALDSARIQVENARATYHETRSELGEVESRADYLQRQLQRQQELARTGVVSATKLEEAQNDASVARNRLNVVRTRLQRMLTMLGSDPAIPTDRHPLVRDKMAERDRAALDLRHTTVVAPIGGVAVNVKLQPGEQVKAATPLFVIVSDRRPWVEANLKETELTHVRVGQKARVVLDIYPDEIWEGVVESISPATGAEFAILPPQNASGNWVKVVQRLPARVTLLSHDKEAPLRAGTTATVSIDTGRQRRLGDIVTAMLGRTSANAAIPR
ncbi:MAG: HlyD family secretion protein [Acetobacteraceae bacterium]